MTKLVGIAVLMGGLTLGPAAAQAPADPNRPAETPSYSTPGDMNRDDGFDLGWLGLIGLAGLAGLARKRDRHDTIDRTATRM